MIRRTDNALVSSLWLIVTVSMVSWFSALPSLLITQWWWRDVERHWWDYKIELLIYNRILKLFDMSFKYFILGHEYLRSSHPWDDNRPPLTNVQTRVETCYIDVVDKNFWDVWRKNNCHKHHFHRWCSGATFKFILTTTPALQKISQAESQNNLSPALIEW